MAPPTLGYWDILSLAEPIRILLTYTKTDFENVVYECGDAPDFDPTPWTSVKPTLGLDFPNLPYYIDGEIKITQSNAILRHIAAQHDLVGKTPLEKAKCLEVEGTAFDFRHAMISFFYNTKDVEARTEVYLSKTLPAKLQSFENLLQKKPFTCGDSLTFVDFVVYEIFYENTRFSASCLEGYTAILNFMKKIEALEPIKEFLKTHDHLTKPINNKMAHFQG